MIALDEHALMCDLAETYQIYDYRQLPVSKVAVFAVGLSHNSRIKLKMSGLNMSVETIILARIADDLSTLVWFNSEDGQKGRNRPKRLLDLLLSNETEQKDDDILAFDSGEEFEAYRNKLLKGGE